MDSAPRDDFAVDQNEQFAIQWLGWIEGDAQPSCALLYIQRGNNPARYIAIKFK